MKQSYFLMQKHLRWSNCVPVCQVALSYVQILEESLKKEKKNYSKNNSVAATSMTHCNGMLLLY